MKELDTIREVLKQATAEHLRHHQLLPEWALSADTALVAIEKALNVGDKTMRVEIHKGKGGKNWFVKLVVGNSETLAVSEGYYSQWNAKRAAKRMFPGLEVSVWPTPKKGYVKFP
jgi:uncharacterized protein YegP (UPF0339 family)